MRLCCLADDTSSSYFSFGTPSSSTHSADSSWETSSACSRSSVNHAPPRKIPKSMMRGPTVFGTAWSECGTVSEPVAGKPKPRYQSQNIPDAFQYQSKSNIAEATKRYRQIVERVNASVNEIRAVPSLPSLPSPNIGSIQPPLDESSSSGRNDTNTKQRDDIDTSSDEVVVPPPENFA